MRTKLMPLTLVAAVAAAVGIARADVMIESLPEEQIKQFSPLALALIKDQFPDPPVKVEAQPELTQGYLVQKQFGVVIIPDKNLTADAIDKAGEKEIPVGILATKSLTLEDKEALVGADKVAVANFNDILKIPVFFLATKAAGDVRTLEVYSKAGKPLVSIPLKKLPAAGMGTLTAKLANVDLEKKKLDVNLAVAGAYETTVKMGYQEF